MKTPARLAALLLAAVLLLTACSPSEIVEAPDTSAAADLEVHFFNAGKADAILLTTADSAVLIDAGEKSFGKTILSYLEEKGITHLDYLIVTHFDQDHVGGAAKVLEGVTVGAVLQSNRPRNSREYENYIEALNSAGIVPVTVRETCEFALDGVSYGIDPPRKTENQKDESNNSDTNQKTYDVLKLPHHGREEPLLDALLVSVKPSYAVITSSDDEPESKTVVETLEQAGIGVLLTREGAVTMHSDGTELRFVSLS